MTSTPSILITIDVEDWFQVENFKPWISYESWGSRELRVERNVHTLLDLFDAVSLFPSSGMPAAPKATFFVLGWIAQRLPHLVREIHNRGHEVASHGFSHALCATQPLGDLKKDLSQSRQLLEEMIGARVHGYRAPSFSVNDDVLQVIEDAGYLYDSSFNSFELNSRYGRLNLADNPRGGVLHLVSPGFFELPVSNLKFGTATLPLGGGGYFRLLPFPFFRLGVHRVLEKEGSYLFYLHPWEIDPEQPRVKEADFSFKFRHYVNLGSTLSKLKRLITSFPKANFSTCRQFINQNITARCARAAENGSDFLVFPEGKIKK
jgi:polysaccharide deacetylase family protein (PEP-CTERM system associated)